MECHKFHLLVLVVTHVLLSSCAENSGLPPKEFNDTTASSEEFNDTTASSEEFNGTTTSSEEFNGTTAISDLPLPNSLPVPTTTSVPGAAVSSTPLPVNTSAPETEEEALFSGVASPSPQPASTGTQAPAATPLSTDSGTEEPAEAGGVNPTTTVGTTEPTVGTIVPAETTEPTEGTTVSAETTEGATRPVQTMEPTEGTTVPVETTEGTTRSDQTTKPTEGSTKKPPTEPTTRPEIGPDPYDAYPGQEGEDYEEGDYVYDKNLPSSSSDAYMPSATTIFMAIIVILIASAVGYVVYHNRRKLRTQFFPNTRNFRYKRLPHGD